MVKGKKILIDQLSTTRQKRESVTGGEGQQGSPFQMNEFAGPENLDPENLS